jgi:hypothetical protein
MRPFDPSMMVHFRKRIGPNLIKVCNQLTKANGIAMIQQLLASCDEGGSGVETGDLNAVEAELGVRPASDDPGSNWGTLMLDAICVPDDIPYPVDLRLLNEARETTELVIDKMLSEMRGGIKHKPRCNRDKARNLFLAFIKKKKPKKAEIREAKRFQLNEIRRNLLAIDKLIHCCAKLSGLDSYLYRKLLVTSDLLSCIRNNVHNVKVNKFLKAAPVIYLEFDLFIAQVEKMLEYQHLKKNQWINPFAPYIALALLRVAPIK